MLSGHAIAGDAKSRFEAEKPTVAVLDYGTGNLLSLCQGLRSVGAIVELVSRPQDISRADKIVLPGVGAFRDAKIKLDQCGLAQAVQDRVADGAQLLGVCLGMQLLAETGEEVTETEGLALIPGRVVRLEPKAVSERIPHVGWNTVRFSRDAAIFDNIPDGRDFYFLHSYRFEPAKPEHILATTPYCGELVSAIGAGRVTGCQFHPEKSQQFGLRLLQNFVMGRGD